MSGYLTYWICKLKPIQIIDPEIYKDNNRAAEVANELVSLFISSARINESNAAKGRYVLIKDPFVLPCVYTLKYRPITGDMLSLIYYLLDESSHEAS
jgi:hypothetical protein